MLILIRLGFLVLVASSFSLFAGRAAASKGKDHGPSHPVEEHSPNPPTHRTDDHESGHAPDPTAGPRVDHKEDHKAGPKASHAAGHAPDPKTGLGVDHKEDHKADPKTGHEAGHGPDPKAGHPADQNIDGTHFSTIPSAVQKKFQLIVDARRPENLRQAILKTKQLMQKKGLVGETAAFLLGDLYLRQAEGGDSQGTDNALRAFGKAVRNYPNSGNVAKALLKKGDIYFDRKLYPEALGNYQRVSQSEDQRYAGFGEVGLARSFQAWRRWGDVLMAVHRSDSLPLSPDDRKRMEFIRTDAIYQRGRYEDAFQAYKVLLPKNGPLPNDPTALFQYAESAYRTGRQEQMHGEMRTLLETAYSVDTQGPVASLALARLHMLLKIDGETKEAENASDTVYAMMHHLPAVKAGKVIVATSNLALLSCPNPCTSSEATLNLQQLAKAAKGLVMDRPFTMTSQGAVFEGLAQLRRYERFEDAEEVHTLMAQALPSLDFSPYTLPTRGLFRQTVLDHFDARDDPKVRVSIYRRFRWALEDKMAGEIGLKVAKSYIQLEDFATALNLLLPVARNTGSPASQEALYQRAALLAKVGDYKAAMRAFVEYRERYPDQHAMLAELGNVYSRLEMFESAAVAYEMWLQHYSGHDKRHLIYQKLSDAYSRVNDLPNQIRTYQAWIPQIPKEADRPYMELAEAYHRHGQVKEAIRYYELALTFEKEQKEMEWGLLHLADAYVIDGQIKRAKGIYQEVQKRAKNPLIKKIAVEKGRDLKVPLVKGS